MTERRWLAGGLVGVLALPLALVACPGTAVFRRKGDLPAVVRIDLPGVVGSGFFITRDLIATNAHVLGDAGSAVVSSGEAPRVRARLVYRDVDLDFAILESPLRGDPLPIRSGPITPGEVVVAIGFPQGRNVVAASTGTVRGVSDLVIVHDALIAAGSSGGPLLDGEGRVVGVNTVLTKYRGDPANVMDRTLAVRITAILQSLAARS